MPGGKDSPVNSVVSGGEEKKFATVGTTKLVVATCCELVVPGPIWVISQAVPLALLASVVPMFTEIVTPVNPPVDVHDSAAVPLPLIACALVIIPSRKATGYLARW